MSDDDVWLAAMVEACYPALDRLLFLVNTRPWNGPLGDNRSTLAAIRSCEDPASKIVVVDGDWPDEVAQGNDGLAHCAKASLSHCFVVDADEIYDTETLRGMIRLAFAVDDIDVWRITLHTYWKFYCDRIDPPEPSAPAVILRIGQTSFSRARQADSTRVGRFPREYATCHHMSYARSDDQIRKRISRFSHSHQLLPGWFECVWRGWDNNPEMQGYSPGLGPGVQARCATGSGSLPAGSSSPVRQGERGELVS